jgi:hypothetical protein
MRSSGRTAGPWPPSGTKQCGSTPTPSQDLPEEDAQPDPRAPAGRAPRTLESSLRHRAETADPYLNEAERMLMEHIIERAAAEVHWHEELIDRMPKIAADLEAGIGRRESLLDLQGLDVLAAVITGLRALDIAILDLQRRDDLFKEVDRQFVG